jgi:hypothetical protein
MRSASLIGIDREGLERPHPRVRVREEQLCENEAGDGAVEKEIVPLDRGADGGRNDCAAQLRLVFGGGKLDDGGGLGILSVRMRIAPKKAALTWLAPARRTRLLL